MLKKEEIMFNEKKESFEKALNLLKEAESAYDNGWTLWSDTRYGITKEQYDELREFIKTAEVGVPTRGAVIDLPAMSAMPDMPNTTKSSNFFSRIWSYIVTKLKLNQKQVTTKQEEPEEFHDESENQDNQQMQDDSQKTYDVPELIRQCTLAREAWIKASQMLDVEYERHLNDRPSGSVVKTERDGPGILDDYRQSSWGIERICLDGFQNHLPADSKGTRCYLHFLVDNKWVDRDTAMRHRDRIKKVRFADNGVGFTADNLFFLHSTKTSEDISAGQFGEGMKLASIAAVNLGLGLEFQSRNWSAIAGSEEKRLTNTRNADQEEIRRRLMYDVTTYSGNPINGSRTIFHTPTPEFIDYALQLPEKVLELGGIVPEFTSDSVEIVDTEKGRRSICKRDIFNDFERIFFIQF